MAKKAKYYVVWKGYQPGIYSSWTDCQLQIKGYPGAQYKSYTSRAEAEAAFSDPYEDAVDTGSGKPEKPARPRTDKQIVTQSIAVDAACSGNPGKMEYQGVHTSDGARIFHKAFPIGTNNIGEFLAIVHALALLKQQGKDWPIYSDSTIAMGWVRKKKCRTNLKRTPATAGLYELIERAENWLRNNDYPNRLLKWETSDWGEIPADFGRK